MNLQTLAPTEMTVAVETITPDLASWWLQMNTHNRPVNKAHVAMLADDMIKGRWTMNGEPIQFDREGRVLNGQHRLHAIIKANIPVQILVVRGLQPIAQDTIDIGAPRRMSHILHLNGYTSVRNLAALAVADWRYTNRPDMTWGTTATTPSKVEQLELVNANKTLYAEAISQAQIAHKKANVAATAYAGLFVLVSRAGRLDSWESFHAAVCDGVGLTSGDARLTFRNLSMRRQNVLSGASWSQQAMLGMGIKAFNFYTAGKPVQRLGFRRDELPMPEIK